jgi:hypothetical protein
VAFTKENLPPGGGGGVGGAWNLGEEGGEGGVSVGGGGVGVAGEGVVGGAGDAVELRVDRGGGADGEGEGGRGGVQARGDSCSSLSSPSPLNSSISRALCRSRIEKLPAGRNSTS